MAVAIFFVKPEETIDYTETEDNGNNASLMGTLGVESQDADEEWSEGTDDAHRSVTLTDVPAETPSMSEEDTPESSTRGIEGVYTDGVRHTRHDVTDAIMDRIDKELKIMTTLKVPGKQRKPRKSEHLSKNGVVFSNDKNIGVIRGVPMIRLSKSSQDLEGTIDTGLGTASNQDDITASTTGEDKRIIGTAHTYSDVTISSDSNLSEEEAENSVKCAPAIRVSEQYQLDLDSDAAQQVDENYRQIMKKKRGGYLDALKTKGPNISDGESIQTEDFEEKFKGIMDHRVPELAPCLKVPEQPTHLPPTHLLPRAPTPVNRKLFPSHPPPAGSTCTDDLLHATKDGRPSSPSKPSEKTRVSRKFKRSSKHNGQSDHDSVMTEDFEYQFHDMMVKQVAHVPITSFDQFIVDSDLDTVKSALIKNKFKQALQNMGDHSELSSSDTESTPRLHDRKSDRKRTDGPNMATGAWVIPQKGQSMQSLPPGSMVHIPYQMIHPQGQPTQAHTRSKGRSSSKRTGSGRLKSSSNFSLPLEDTPEDTSEEISRETARIRQELEDERRLKVRAQPAGDAMTSGSTISMSTPNLHLLHNSNYGNDSFAPTNKMALKMSDENRAHMVQELNNLTSAVQKAKRDKQSALTELKTVQEKLRQHRNDVRQMDQQIKENRAKGENARTDLMLMEFKRDSAKKELQRITEEVERKRQALEESGFRNAEELAAMRTENEQLKGRAEQSEQLQREVQELERQLDAKKESQFNEQKKLRVKVEELEEQLENKTHLLEEATSDRDAVQRKFSKLEIKFKSMETSKNALLEEKTTDYEELRDRLQEQLSLSKSEHVSEAADLRAQLSDVTNKMEALQKEVADKEEAVMSVKEKLLEKDHELQQYMDKIEAIRDENSKSSENIRVNFKREIEEALTSVRLSLEKDKREALEKLERDMEDRYTADLDQLENSLRQEISALQGQLTGKEVEVGVLRDRVRQQEEAAKTLGEVLRKDAQQQVQAAVDAEKNRSAGERERAIREAISTAIPDHERLVRSLKEQLGAERDVREQNVRQLDNFKKELEEARTQNRSLYMDKLTAMNQAKESAQQEKDRQLDQLKEQIEKETMRQIERLRETIERQEEEISRLRAEKTDLTQHQQENLSQVERQEKMVIQEINDECSKTADLLGVVPRKVGIPSFGSSWTEAKSGTYSAQGPLKTALNTSLANLRASHDELRKHVIEIKTELANQKLAVSQTQQAKSQELEAVKEKMSAEKIAAMGSLKDRLIKEHLQEVGRFTKSINSEDGLSRALREKDNELHEILRNMSHWKEQTAEKLALKFSEEMDREVEKRLKDHRRAEREWERERTSMQRDMERMERDAQRRHTNAPMATSARPPLPDHSSSTSNVLNLQAQLRHLQSENASLKRSSLRGTGGVTSTSTPDLTTVGVRPSTPVGGSAYLLHNTSLPASPASTMSHVTGSGTGPASLGALEDRVRQAERRSYLGGDHRGSSHLGGTDYRGSSSRADLPRSPSRSTDLNRSYTSGTTPKSKELLQLERAYSQLQRQSPVR